MKVSRTPEQRAAHNAEEKRRYRRKKALRLFGATVLQGFLCGNLAEPKDPTYTASRKRAIYTWRERHPERYRKYLREYMRARRGSTTQRVQP